MPRVSHFDIPADDPKRAQKFYKEVFGWKFKKWDGPMDYWMAKTGTKEPGIDGGISKRMPGQIGMTNTIDVPSIEKFSKKIMENGGQLIIPQDGYSKSWMVCTMHGYRRKHVWNHRNG